MSRIAVCSSDTIDGVISSASEKDEVMQIADCGVAVILVLKDGRIVVSTAGERGAIIEAA